MVTEAKLTVRATPHTLRHSAGSEMINAGKSMTAVRDILGHADFFMTNIYAHAGRKDLVEATKALERSVTDADLRKAEQLQRDFQMGPR